MIIYEYCFISTLGKEGSPNECKISYYSDGTEDISKQKLSKVINEMAEFYWEMVGCGNTGNGSHNIYFRRDKNWSEKLQE